jgi:hypothetical protein
MDATLKRKVWKVIGYHLFFTAYVVLLLAFASHPMILNPSDPAHWYPLLGQPLLILLQPLSYVVERISGSESAFLFFMLMPIWSLCFGWLFVKFDNWLNHFPVLGKRVF